MSDPRSLLDPLREIHGSVRDAVVDACEAQQLDETSNVSREQEGDTIYAIDRVAEHVLVGEIGRTIATPDEPVVLIAEGLPRGEVIVPQGARHNVRANRADRLKRPGNSNVPCRGRGASGKLDPWLISTSW